MHLFSCRYSFNTDGWTASVRFAKLLATGQVSTSALALPAVTQPVHHDCGALQAIMCMVSLLPGLFLQRTRLTQINQRIALRPDGVSAIADTGVFTA